MTTSTSQPETSKTSAIYKDTRPSHQRDRFAGCKYSEGTRVAERPKFRYDCCNSPEGYLNAQRASSQRYGVVVGNRVKRIKRKSGVIYRRVYVMVQWDNLNSPMEHDQQRICTIEEFEKLEKITRLSIGS
jgi:hypothetical protein